MVGTVAGGLVRAGGEGLFLEGRDKEQLSLFFWPFSIFILQFITNQ